MNANRLSRMALAVAAVLLAARPVSAQTAAVGPYYAVPSWDQTIACSTLTNCPRFVVLSNMASAAVLDRETGLVWERTPRDGDFSYDTAALFCAQSGVGGRFGWRLPSMPELQSLLVPRSAAPGDLFLPDGHPFIGVTADSFWSHTRRPSDFLLVSPVGNTKPGMTTGPGVISASPTDSRNRMWCVRGGGPIPAY